MKEVSAEEVRRATLASYNAHTDEYTAKRRTDADGRTVAYWPGVEFFLSQLQPGQEIFEIGSGVGADAKLIEQEGFCVKRSDAAQAFLDLFRQQGQAAQFYDILDGPFTKKQSAILASAVFLHFTIEQFRAALRNTHLSLVPNGLFCLGMKMGDFEGWRNKGLSGKRYFKFWQPANLEVELIDQGFTVLNTFVTSKKDFIVITAQANQAK